MTSAAQKECVPRSRYAWLFLLLLIGAGLTTNMFLGVELFFHNYFLFGSIFAFLALQFLGVGAGVVAAFCISSSTYYLWNHPYALVVLTLEMVTVGVLVRRRQLGLVVADTIFWLALGMPLVYIFNHLVMGLQLSQVQVSMLKQAVNGITNALVARLLYMTLVRYYCQTRLSLREVLFNILAFAVLLSSLFFFVGQSRNRVADLEHSTRGSLLHARQRVVDNLDLWLRDKLGVVVYLAEQAARKPIPAMQALLTPAQEMDTNFLRLVQVDRQAISVAAGPLYDEFGHSNIGNNYADRPFIPTLQERLTPMLSEVLLSKVGNHSPMVILLAPVGKGGQYAGYMAGVLDLTTLREQIALNVHGQMVTGVRFSLVDTNNRVIVSNRPELQTMDLFARGAGTMTPFGDGVGVWAPLKQRNISVLDRWENALYVTETPIGNLAEWRLILEMRIAPMLEKLYSEFALRLAEVLFFFLGALMVAFFLSRRLITALEELMVTSSLLPTKLLAQESIVWPESTTLEIDRLIGNYRQMAQALASQFQEVRALNLGLEAKVDERTKELRESEGRFRALLESVPAIPVQGYDRERRVFFWNQASEALYGFKAEEAVGRQLEDLIIPEPMRAGVVMAVNRWISEGVPIPAGELLLQGKDGRPCHVFSSHVLQKNSRGEAEMYCIDVDMSARKQKEKELKQTLEEKETLLREVHHRVKNNMAVISGLLALQAGQIKDEAMKTIFAESQQRVKSLALIHEKLYRSGDVSHIDFGEYLKLIANELLAFRNHPDHSIQATIEVEQIILDIDTAIPCGLIVNELLTNALKYAFPGGRPGAIKIGFTQRERLFTLTVKDNGVGLPPGFDYRQATSLGLQLVEALTAQIRGTWNLTSKDGTEVVISFQGKGA